LISLKSSDAILADEYCSDKGQTGHIMWQSARSISPLRCDLCGGVMTFVRRLAASGADVHMALYRCEQCQHTITRPIEGDEREHRR
jgi:hypothetical protein